MHMRELNQKLLLMFSLFCTCKELQREGYDLLFYRISVNKRRASNKRRTINNQIRINATL